MKKEIENRVIECAHHIIENDNTVRKTAAALGLSKSTVHKDLSVRLEKLDRALYLKVKKILQRNKAERHMRGGMATCAKYRRLRGE